MNCIRCKKEIADEIEHGNRKRCRKCALQHKREYNKKRQQIIRAISDRGLKNHRLLSKLYEEHNGEISRKFTFEELVQMGFSFNYGYVNLQSSQNNSLYTNTIGVIEFELYFNVNKPQTPVKITKNNE